LSRVPGLFLVQLIVVNLLLPDLTLLLPLLLVLGVGLLPHQYVPQFLQNLVQNKSIQIESYGTDKYGRILAYIFLKNKNINKEILQQGLATLYYYEHDSHYEELEKAEEFARLNQKGLWEKSKNEMCLEIIEFDYISEGGEKLVLKNHCNPMEVIIKDDATHIYRETLPKGIWEKSFNKIWNDAGDTLYVSDEEGLLIFHRYN